jgi:hypothetical protein
MRSTGKLPCQPAAAPVTKYSWRTGTTGRSTPASRATAPAHGPAALITRSVATVRWPVRMPVTAPRARRSPVTVACVANVTPRSRAARA